MISFSYRANIEPFVKYCGCSAGRVKVIAAARKVFAGSLTASCNGSPGITGQMALNITYWHALDFIGIDTFPAVHGNPVAVRTT
eukprot:SAG31_NODE_2097_length_6453_cov_16.072867_7_plen_84_part_00